ncbi:TatD DNase family protein [Pedobacter cryoconitis]|uniref:TatD DNase family protein n=1 Tax=Pedobacter cryoconitis TaxID=188932 RepID=A0A7W8YSE8_9SPHI|nr:Qat anti-phage system TatD family nuclease QatD [Pedobacter cryoconitis]MBB5620960.1 TatD DNase family protein [Pedobacter cryoconitis]
MIDTHCHIDLYSKPENILFECEKSGITVIAMTNLPSHFQMGLPHVLPFKRIRLALGMHPLHAKLHQKEFPLFLKNLSKTSYIGEVGLDFSREGFSTKDLQLTSFAKILTCLSREKKILSLHSRRAEKEVLEHLQSSKIRAAIFHWYSGPLALIDKIAGAGYYFSINPAMIQSENGQKIISRIPVDKILPETDGPFTEVSGRPSKPSDVALVYHFLSKIWEKNLVEVDKIISANFQRLISHLK